jgi:hypothetical protein
MGSDGRAMAGLATKHCGHETERLEPPLHFSQRAGRYPTLNRFPAFLSVPRTYVRSSRALQG